MISLPNAGTGRGASGSIRIDCPEQLMRHALPQLDTVTWYGVAIGLE